MNLEHYSSTPGLTQTGIHPSFYGKGEAGGEARRQQSPEWLNRSFFYKHGGDPEKQLKFKPYKYQAQVDAGKIYDASTDPLNLRGKAKFANDWTSYEKAIHDAGFHGYHTPHNPNPIHTNTVVMFHPVHPHSVENMRKSQMAVMAKSAVLKKADVPPPVMNAGPTPASAPTFKAPNWAPADWKARPDAPTFEKFSANPKIQGMPVDHAKALYLGINDAANREKFSINSGARTYQEQQALRSGGNAMIPAKVGESGHHYQGGRSAVDLAVFGAPVGTPRYNKALADVAANTQKWGKVINPNMEIARPLHPEKDPVHLGFHTVGNVTKYVGGKAFNPGQMSGSIQAGSAPPVQTMPPAQGQQKADQQSQKNPAPPAAPQSSLEAARTKMATPALARKESTNEQASAPTTPSDSGVSQLTNKLSAGWNRPKMGFKKSENAMKHSESHGKIENIESETKGIQSITKSDAPADDMSTRRWQAMEASHMAKSGKWPVPGLVPPSGDKKPLTAAQMEPVKKAVEPLSKPPTSESQRRAMFAAASGHSNIGIPQKVGKEFAEADKGGKLPEKIEKAAVPAVPSANGDYNKYMAEKVKQIKAQSADKKEPSLASKIAQMKKKYLNKSLIEGGKYNEEKDKKANTKKLMDTIHKHLSGPKDDTPPAPLSDTFKKRLDNLFTKGKEKKDV